MANQAYIWECEERIVEATKVVKSIGEAAAIELASNNGKLNAENMDHWGTLLVNAECLWLDLSTVIESLKQYRGES